MFIYSYDGDTALHIASANSFSDIVLLLMNAGVDYTIANKKGQYPVDLATNEQIRRIILTQYIIIYISKKSPLPDFDQSTGMCRTSMFLLSLFIEAIIPLLEDDDERIMYMPDVKVYPYAYLHPSEFLSICDNILKSLLSGFMCKNTLLYESVFYAVFKCLLLWVENEINEDNDNRKKSDHNKTFFRRLLIDNISDVFNNSRLKDAISISNATIDTWKTIVDILISSCIKNDYWSKRDIYSNPDNYLTEYTLKKEKLSYYKDHPCYMKDDKVFNINIIRFIQKNKI